MFFLIEASVVIQVFQAVDDDDEFFFNSDDDNSDTG